MKQDFLSHAHNVVQNIFKCVMQSVDLESYVLHMIQNHL